MPPQNRLAMPPPPTRPVIAPPACEVTPEPDGYWTDDQSITNVARKDKFQLVLDIPCRLKPFLKKENRQCNGGSLDRLQFSIWGYIVPEVSVPKGEKSYAGQVFNYSSNTRPSYGAINIDFTVDNKYDNYYILWKWLNLQNDSVTGISSPMEDYMTNISVIAMDENDVPVAEWIYHDSFVTLLGGIKPASRDAGELECTFSFEFSYLEMDLL